MNPQSAPSRLLLLLLALLVAGPGWAQRTVLHCGKLIDVAAGKVLAERSVVVEGDHIVAVEAGFVRGKEDRVVDLRSATCLPGLMDMHTHLYHELTATSYAEGPRLEISDYTIRAVANAHKTLMAGFTTVRDLGDVGNLTVALKRAIAVGTVDGPRIYTATKALATTGGHADPTNGLNSELAGDPGPREGVVNGVDDIRKAVRQRYKDGADLIKITATGGVLSVAPNGQNPQFTEEEMRAVVETANDYGFAVAAHAHGAEGIKRAVRAGVRSIEHGTLMDDEGIQLMKEHGTYYVPTLLAGEFVAEKAAEEGFLPEMVRPKAAELGPKIQATFSRAYHAGVKIAFGTDTGVSPHGQNAREFQLMVEAGMPALEAIRSATLTASQLLGVEARLGTLEPGKLADVVAVPGDPSQDVSTLMNVSFVMKGGTVYKQP